MRETHITVVLNSHNEGMLLHPTVLSLQMAKKRAEAEGLKVEVIVVQDNPSPDTVEYFHEHGDADFTHVRVSLGDPGLARNAGIERAQGEWIALLDGDDLWGPNWLAQSYQAACSDPRQVIWHPEVNQYFGIDPHIFAHVDMEDPSFDLLTLTINNYWTVASFSPRRVYRTCPYPATLLDQQLGYEDWSWNNETIREGYLHKIVPGTVHFIRQKRFSQVRQTNARLSLPYPTLLFKTLLNSKDTFKEFTHW